MVHLDLLEQLRCPYCGSELEVAWREPTEGRSIRNGILRCFCYQYPIIHGIVVLRQCSTAAGPDVCWMVDRLKQGDSPGALHHALNLTYPNFLCRTLRQRLARFTGSLFARYLAWFERKRTARRVISDRSLTFEQALRLMVPESYAQYLLHRYASPGFLAAVAMLSILPEAVAGPVGGHGSGEAAVASPPARVLDLGCGSGHASYVIENNLPGFSSVAADHDFRNLYLARRFLIPRTACVCLDAEAPLPFPEEFFDVVLCLDTFPYIRSKAALVAEADRVLKPDGLCLFPHLYNSLCETPPGPALAPEAYLQCFERLNGRLFRERDILRGFLDERCVDLSEGCSRRQLERTDVLCLVAARREDIWRRYDNATAILYRDSSALRINPIYRPRCGNGVVHMQLNWPNAKMERECALMKQFLPPQCTVGAGLYERIRNGRTTGEEASRIRQLAESFVLVNRPAHYVEEERVIDSPRYSRVFSRSGQSRG